MQSLRFILFYLGTILSRLSYKVDISRVDVVS